MKKMISALACCFLFILSMNTYAQSTSDYFVGQWNVVVTGTPSGDAEMIISLERKDGKYGGTVKLREGELIDITDISESEKSITLNFPAGGYDVRLTLEKKDDNHVGGNLMDQFEAKGERIMKGETGKVNVQSTSDFFVGQWNLLVAGTPDGDIKMIVSLERKEGQLVGTINIVDYETSKISKIDEKGLSLTLYFSAAGYDLYISLEKKDENHITGKEMDLFNITGERKVK